jgi:hypothetical protein
MGLVFLDQGLIDALDRLTGNNTHSQLNGALLGLYVNNHTPVQTDVAGAFTEASWSGYARQVITGWTFGATLGGLDYTVGDAVLIPNTTGSPQSAYGLLLFEATTGLLLAAALFVGAPVTVSPLGLITQVTVQATDL